MNCCRNLRIVKQVSYKLRFYSTFHIKQGNNNFTTSDHKYVFQTKTERQLISRSVSFASFAEWQGNVYTSISNSYPVGLIQDTLLHFHNINGLPWWGTIITSTIVIRMFMTLPLTIYQSKILARVEMISLELKDLMNDLKTETAMAKKLYNLTDRQANILYRRSIKKQWRLLIVRDNCHPFKASFVIWFQIPVWICMSFALRNLVYTNSDPLSMITFLELSREGFGWIPNLTEPDHSYIFPVAFGLTNLAILEMQRMSKLRQPSKLYNVFTNVLRVFSIVMIPVSASVPSCMCLYWFTSSTCGLIQNLLLLSPSLRRKLRIPETPSELENPYSHIKEEIKYSVQKLIPKKS